MNKNISNIHLESLDKKRLEVLQKISPMLPDFVLGGGSALALQLVHRKSFDFDFFSLSEISKKLLEELSQVFTIRNVSIDTSEELTFFTSEDIKITLLHYPFKSIFDHVKTEGGLKLFSTAGIAMQKAYTIGRRGEYRDYFDLYIILKRRYINLKVLIRGTKQIYGSVFDEKIFLEQLVYFGDLTNFDITPATRESLPTPDQIKHYLGELVKNYI